MKNLLFLACLKRAFYFRQFLPLMILGIFLTVPRISSANACGATPAAETFNGIPAYTDPRCYGNAIWSRDGIETSTYKKYKDSVNTNSGFGYQCAELGKRYFRFRHGKTVSYSGSMSDFGANNLCVNALPPRTRRKNPRNLSDPNNIPVPGDLMVWPGAPGGGTCGVRSQHGHVAVVNKVWNPNSVEVIQQNWGHGEKGARMNFKTSCACAFIHAEDNTLQNGPPVDTPEGTGEEAGRNYMDGMTCPATTDDSDALRESGLKVCCIKPGTPDKLWPPGCKKASS